MRFLYVSAGCALDDDDENDVYIRRTHPTGTRMKDYKEMQVLSLSFFFFFFFFFWRTTLLSPAIPPRDTWDVNRSRSLGGKERRGRSGGEFSARLGAVGGREGVCACLSLLLPPTYLPTSLSLSLSRQKALDCDEDTSVLLKRQQRRRRSLASRRPIKTKRKKRNRKKFELCHWSVYTPLRLIHFSLFSLCARAPQKKRKRPTGPSILFGCLRKIVQLGRLIPNIVTAPLHRRGFDVSSVRLALTRRGSRKSITVVFFSSRKEEDSPTSPAASKERTPNPFWYLGLFIVQRTKRTFI